MVFKSTVRMMRRAKSTAPRLLQLWGVVVSLEAGEIRFRMKSERARSAPSPRRARLSEREVKRTLACPRRIIPKLRRPRPTTNESTNVSSGVSTAPRLRNSLRRSQPGTKKRAPVASKKSRVSVKAIMML
jgi:hypothetical protein